MCGHVDCLGCLGRGSKKSSGVRRGEVQRDAGAAVGTASSGGVPSIEMLTCVR